MSEAAIDTSHYVPKDEHDRQVEVLQNIIGAMLRDGGDAGWESHIRDLDGFGARYVVATELKPDGRLRVMIRERGVIPARVMPTVPLGTLKRIPPR